MIKLTDLAIGCLVTVCWLALPATWSLLNAGGACLGRSIAWFCSGGLGLWMARYHLGHLRQQQAMSELRARLAAERWRSSGFPAGELVRALQAGGVAYPRRTLLARQYDRQQAARD